MDLSKIVEVVNWLKEHPRNLKLDSMTPSQVWYYFCDQPSIRNEYDNSKDYRMEAPTIPNGCDYLFNIGGRCNCVPVPGKTRCVYHDHFIFSEELKHYLTNLKESIDRAYYSRYPPEEKSPSENIPVSLSVIYVRGNFYYEPINRLAILEQEDAIICFGHFPSSLGSNCKSFHLHQAIELTDEQKEWCHQREIVVLD